MTEELSALNKSWNICGFASVLGALYQNHVIVENIKDPNLRREKENPALKKIKENIDDAVRNQNLNTRLLSEIRTYIRILQSESSPLLNDITSFTASFGGRHAKFTIGNFIKEIDKIVDDKGKINTKRLNKDFAIAMPPDGVVDYLRRNGMSKSVKEEISKLNPVKNNVILGIGDKDKVKKPYKGLVHWVYRKNVSEIYNWGKCYREADLLKERSLNKPHFVYQIILG